MRKIAFFGGTSGLGSQVKNYLTEHTIDVVGSNLVNFENLETIDSYFKNNKDIEVLIIFNNYNYNSFMHKYTNDTDNQLLKQININITGITQSITRALKSMREQRFGRIIIASSITVDRNVMGTGVYAASKAYMENLVKTISIENASTGITANCIQLGYMDGGLTYTLSPDFIETIVNSIPAKRLGKPEEIANTIKYLIDTEYVNGSTIKITGGL
jgi:NAD(P)-dependent dehydrogenase (short-subunit alcohol dehydrogenase family)